VEDLEAMDLNIMVIRAKAREYRKKQRERRMDNALGYLEYWWDEFMDGKKCMDGHAPLAQVLGDDEELAFAVWKEAVKIVTMIYRKDEDILTSDEAASVAVILSVVWRIATGEADVKGTKEILESKTKLERDSAIQIMEKQEKKLLELMGEEKYDIFYRFMLATILTENFTR